MSCSTKPWRRSTISGRRWNWTRRMPRRRRRGVACLGQHNPPPAVDTSIDGTWFFREVCPVLGNALGYTTDVTVKVSGGVLHGEIGVRSQPGSLSLDGRIADQGPVSIKATGLIGSDRAH